MIWKRHLFRSWTCLYIRQVHDLTHNQCVSRSTGSVQAFGLWSVLNLNNLLFIALPASYIVHVYAWYWGTNEVYCCVFISPPGRWFEMLALQQIFYCQSLPQLRNKAMNLFHQPRVSTPSHGETIWDLLRSSHPHWNLTAPKSCCDLNALYSIYSSGYNEV